MFIDIFDSLVVLIVFDLVDSNAGKPATYFVGILQIKIKIKIKIMHTIVHKLQVVIIQPFTH